MDRTTTYYRNALADLEGRMGVAPSEILPDEQVALVKACMRLADPFSEVNAEACGFPVRVAEGVYFWRLTIGASVWLDHVSRLYPCEGTIYRLALVYACLNSRNAEAFRALDTPKAIEEAVRAAHATLAATPEEVNAGLDAIFNVTPRTDAHVDEDAAVDWANLVRLLETQTGIPAKEWIWNRSGNWSVRAYNDLHAFARSYSMATGGSFKHMRDELDEASNALARLKVDIMKRVKNGN